MNIISKYCTWYGVHKTNCKSDFTNYDFYYTTCKNEHIAYHNAVNNRFTICDENLTTLFETTNEILALLILYNGATDINEFFELENYDIY